MLVCNFWRNIIFTYKYIFEILYQNIHCEKHFIKYYIMFFSLQNYSFKWLQKIHNYTEFFSILKNKIIFQKIFIIFFDICIDWWFVFISYDKTCISAVSSCIIVKKNHSVCQLFKLCCMISQAADVHNNIVKLIKKFKKSKFLFCYIFKFLILF